MSEQFDTDLARALKDSAAKNLEGWQFTAAMQRSVLQRIEHTATGTVPAARPSRRFDPGRVIRPLAWTAVAAATLVVVVNTRVGDRGGAMKNAPAGVSAPGAPVAKGPSSTEQTQQAGAPATGTAQGEGGPASPSPAGPSAAGPSAASPRPAAPSPAAPSLAAPVPAAPPDASEPKRAGAGSSPNGVTESNEPAVTKQANQSPQPADTADRKALAAPPEHVGMASIPAETHGAAGTATPSAFNGGTLALQAPPPDGKGKHAPPMGIMAVTRDKLHVQAVGGRVVELSGSTLRSLTPDGAEAWVYPLAGATEESRLALAEDGSVAVALANKVHVLSPAGKLMRTLEPADQATALAWGPGGRLAIAAGSVVTVIRPAQATAEFHTEAISQPELNFGPDGTLAVLGDGKSGRELLLYDKDGALTTRVQQGRSKARGLAFTAGCVVAGSHAYGLLGRPLWEAPFVPQGLTPLPGTDLLVVWKSDTVAALGAADGVPVWQAAWNGSGQGLQRVVAAPDGRFVAVLGATDEGWVFWILNQRGKLLHAERLTDAPSDMAFVGDRLMLLTPQGAEFRSFQH